MSVRLKRLLLSNMVPSTSALEAGTSTSLTRLVGHIDLQGTVKITEQHPYIIRAIQQLHVQGFMQEAGKDIVEKVLGA